MTDVVRLCKPTYSEDLLREHGIEVHDWLFTDGEPPPKAVIDDWLYLINSRLKQCDVEESKSEKPDEADESVEKHPCIAVHCVAGLGRYCKNDRRCPDDSSIFFFFCDDQSASSRCHSFN